MLIEKFSFYHLKDFEQYIADESRAGNEYKPTDEHYHGVLSHYWPKQDLTVSREVFNELL